MGAIPEALTRFRACYWAHLLQILSAAVSVSLLATSSPLETTNQALRPFADAAAYVFRIKDAVSFLARRGELAVVQAISGEGAIQSMKLG